MQGGCPFDHLSCHGTVNLTGLCEKEFPEVLEAGWRIGSAQSNAEMSCCDAPGMVVHSGWQQKHATALDNTPAEHIHRLTSD